MNCYKVVEFLHCYCFYTDNTLAADKWKILYNSYEIKVIPAVNS
jgi:hypothetical protein